MLNSGQGVEVSDTTHADSSTIADTTCQKNQE